MYEMLCPYVEDDTSALYTVDEFDKAVEMLQNFCLMRAESIRGQLNGTIPATADGQKADNSALLDASEIDLQSMGSMGRGNRGGDSGINRGRTNQPVTTESLPEPGIPGAAAPPPAAHD